ncbi:NADH-ubiquinone oxidoreductase, chain 5 [Myxococcus stipitatus DSM 14675]|uniref:NADH-ubiquinone oxidoreductase, chain 5 n=1 Tax=Myxococcus stipitatus (strain DSM 14675 / JCM 12634 / Mx s8) TaxID=1278073 RepID=L7UJK4_MYXSD|nr:monovalent cation/H+ antiporter subunit D family protein [Myxococcus stipitatus]AGC48080.1 NADH-ubiquinone oxidoreductase, chain 5 [Myxococcus stipitatus DSM 14675]
MRSTWLPVWVLLSSLLPGLVIFLLPQGQRRTRTTLNLAAAVTKLGLTLFMAWGVFQGRHYETRVPFLPNADLVLRADTFSLLFILLSAVLWFVTTIYAVGYLEGTEHLSRFFGFFSLCVASTMGIALAGNLLTFFLFYEMLTLSTYPLVIHKGTPDALRAGNVYLRYTLTGATLLLAGVVLLYVLAGAVEFTERGALWGAVEHRTGLQVAFVLMIAGLGVKAALVPLHGWLPVAMVAPAPVSALLHAVAVVKAGAFGITRVIYDVYGVYLVHDLGVMRPLAVVAGITILYGSLRALQQGDLKRRLAYSTVSQVAYIVVGVSIFGTVSTIGGLVHLVHQGVMKITLFFCAGNFAEELHVHRVRDLRGVGRRMPLTMGAFTIAALGMIGIPPVAGFITKWYLGIGALEAKEPWLVGVLLMSSLLNAGYFLPILYSAWFQAPQQEWEPNPRRWEIGLSLLLPTLTTAALSLAMGLFAGWEFSPLSWTKLITEREFRP